MFNSNGSRISSIVTTRQYRRIGQLCSIIVNLHTPWNVLGNESLTMTVVGVVNVVAENEDNNTFAFRIGESPQTLWPGNKGVAKHC